MNIEIDKEYSCDSQKYQYSVTGKAGKVATVLVVADGKPSTIALLPAGKSTVITLRGGAGVKVKHTHNDASVAVSVSPPMR